MHVADAQHVAVDPVPGEVNFRFDRGPGIDGEQTGHRWQGVQVNLGANFGAERPGVIADPRGTGQAGRIDQQRNLFGQP